MFNVLLIWLYLTGRTCFNGVDVLVNSAIEMFTKNELLLKTFLIVEGMIRRIGNSSLEENINKTWIIKINWTFLICCSTSFTEPFSYDREKTYAWTNPMPCFRCILIASFWAMFSIKRFNFIILLWLHSDVP